MKVIIAGGRDYELDEFDRQLLDRLHKRLAFSEVVCGMARGADTGGKVWAEERGLSVTEFPADWDLHGRAAGPLRNRQMAEYADALIALPGGRGTASMVKQARELGLKVLNAGRGRSFLQLCKARSGV